MKNSANVMKRGTSVFLAFLMVFSSFVLLETPAVKASTAVALDSDNWRGWYESYAHPSLQSNGQQLIDMGMNPLSVSEGNILSVDRHTATGFDDFVAVASNGSTVPDGYSITVNIQTGYDMFGANGVLGYAPYISDSAGNGSFSIGIMTENSPTDALFSEDYWPYGVMYGFYDTPGYVLSFKADALSCNYYNSCMIFHGSYLVATVDLTAGLVMANNTADTTVRLVRNGNNYDILISNSNGLSQRIYTITDLTEDQKLYYGVAAFCCSQNGGNYIQTSPAFTVKSVSDCTGSYLPADFTGDGHKLAGEQHPDYYLEYCITCGYISKKRYNITYDANGGSSAPPDTVKEYSCNGNAEAKAVYNISTTVPIRPGYLFDGWKAISNDPGVNGNLYDPGDSVKTGYNLALIAQWSESEYRLTLDPDGGIMPDGYSTVYFFRYGERFVDVIGELPIPAKNGYLFKEWRNLSTGEYWLNIWGTQPYIYDTDITLTAVWEKDPEFKPYNIIFDLDGGKLISGHSGSYSIDIGDTYSSILGTMPVAEREGYYFDGWYNEKYGYILDINDIFTAYEDCVFVAQWRKSSSYTITFNSEGYLNAQDNRVPVTVDVNGGCLPEGGTNASFKISRGQRFSDAVGNTAYYPTHSLWTFAGWIASYTDSDGNAKVLLLDRNSWNTAVFDGASDVTCTAYYICEHSKYQDPIAFWNESTDPDRAIGKCRVCGFDGAYGYRVNFFARYNNEADILLSYGVPQDELFDYENCIYDPANEIIVDYLDITDSCPAVNIHFDPVLSAAKESEYGWCGWKIEGSDMTPEKQIQIIFDQNNDEWNHHIDLRCEYESGYYEIIFNAGTSLKGDTLKTPLENNGVLTDMNRRYGVMAIRSTDNYDSVLDYIPQAKHIGVYSSDPADNTCYNPIPFENGEFYNYSNSVQTLYVSIGWSDAGSFTGNSDFEKTASMFNAYKENRILNTDTSCNEYGLARDSMLMPWYFCEPGRIDTEVLDDGVAQGYLATFYANNKGASIEYNNAYFDPDENSGGTMYYMYTKTGGTYSCTPVFGFDASDYGSDTFIYEPYSFNELSSDFNIVVYDDLFSSYTRVIAKEPKRYTYYMGEGGYFKFPEVAADPDGAFYDHEISNPDKITDKNSNTYYNSLSNRFKLAENFKGVPVCNSYAQYATWEDYDVMSGTLPLGFPSISYYFDGYKPLYTPIYPNGNSNSVFFTGTDRQDYGNMYGIGIPMTYPDGNQYVSMYPELAAAGLPMQSCYYSQWDFALQFNSNYPEGQNYDNGAGYPGSLDLDEYGDHISGNTDENGNHYVYDFFSSFTSTYGKNSEMFSCDGYVIDGWQLYDQADQPVIYDHDYDPDTPGEYLIISTSDNVEEIYGASDMLDWMRLENDYCVSVYDAYLYAREPGCEFRALWRKLPVAGITVSNYTVSLTEADNLSYIRYAEGIYDNASQIKWAQDCVTLNAAKINEYSENGICSIDMPNGGIYSLWLKYKDGRESIVYADVTYMDQLTELYGPTLTVKNLYGVRDMYIGRGTHDSYADVKSNGVVQVTANKIGTAHNYSYTLPGGGSYTLCIRYNDSSRAHKYIHFNVEVTEPVFSENGLQLSVGNLDDVKVIRTAYGDYNTAGDIKRAEGARAFTAKTIMKTPGDYIIQYRENGRVSVAVVYNNGYNVIYKYTVRQKSPIMTESGRRVIFQRLDGLTLIRYAEGVYTSSAEIKRAEGSKVIKPEAIVNNHVAITLDPGTYTFCVQYNDESYNYYVITVE